MTKAIMEKTEDGRWLIKATGTLEVDSIENAQFCNGIDVNLGTSSKEEGKKKVLEALDFYYNRMKDSIVRYCTDNGIGLESVLDENGEVELVPVRIFDTERLFSDNNIEEDDDPIDFLHELLMATSISDEGIKVFLFGIPNMQFIPKKVLEELNFEDRKIIMFKNVPFRNGESFLDIELEVQIVPGIYDEVDDSFKSAMDENTVKYKFEE